MASISELVEEYRKALEGKEKEEGLSTLQQALIQFGPALVGGAVGALSGEPGGAAAGAGIGSEVGTKMLGDIRAATEAKAQRQAKLGEKAFELASKDVESREAKRFKERELALKEREAAGKDGGIEKMMAQKLPAGQAADLGALDAASAQLLGIEQAVQKSQDIMGPIAGRLTTLSPYASKARIFDAEMKIAAQNIGKSLEGGKLTDEDIRRYREMLPNMADTPEVALGKVRTIRQLLADRKQTQVEALRRAGFQTHQFEAQNQTAAMGDALPPGLMVDLQRRGAVPAVPEAPKAKRVTQGGVVFELDDASGQYRPVGK